MKNALQFIAALIKGLPGSSLHSPPVNCELSLIKSKQWKTLCCANPPEKDETTRNSPRHQLLNTCLFHSALSFKCTHSYKPPHIDHLFFTAESNNRADKLGCHRKKSHTDITETVSRSTGGAPSIHRAGFNRHKVPTLEKKSMF